MIIGIKLKAYRTKRNETLHTVAKNLNYLPEYVSRVERGLRLPTDQQLVKFSNYYKVPLNELQILKISEEIVLLMKHYGLTKDDYVNISGHVKDFI